ncbi:hypothetical protein D4764_01G0016520 [Takifugu flavidus]|uniref:Uncharacterized protein n=1 Tax=Takifugu flavidus TaxID=433684 RepID=A0A5C6PTP2_9TELE|nr:hypothetical protein D4764_01G0016520 [Takifugu flavidus]
MAGWVERGEGRGQVEDREERRGDERRGDERRRDERRGEERRGEDGTEHRNTYKNTGRMELGL